MQDRFFEQFESRTKNIEKTIFKYSFSPQNDYNNFLLSSYNKTIEKISGGNSWQGFYCEPFQIFSDKLTYSIKIENTKNSAISFGFSIKNAKKSSFGYRDSNDPSFMLDLRDGECFFNKSENKEKIQGIKGKNKEIYTVILDIKQKNIQFLLDDHTLGEPKIIDFTNDQISLLCPCVDLIDEGDKITINN